MISASTSLSTITSSSATGSYLEEGHIQMSVSEEGSCEFSLEEEDGTDDHGGENRDHPESTSDAATNYGNESEYKQKQHNGREDKEKEQTIASSAKKTLISGTTTTHANKTGDPRGRGDNSCDRGGDDESNGGRFPPGGDTQAQ